MACKLARWDWPESMSSSSSIPVVSPISACKSATKISTKSERPRTVSSSELTCPFAQLSFISLINKSLRLNVGKLCASLIFDIGSRNHFTPGGS